MALVTNWGLEVVQICDGLWSDGAWDLVSGFDDADVDMWLERGKSFGHCFVSPSPDGDYRRHGDRVDCFLVGAGTEQLRDPVGGYAGVRGLSVVSDGTIRRQSMSQTDGLAMQAGSGCWRLVQDGWWPGRRPCAQRSWLRYAW